MTQEDKMWWGWGAADLDCRSALLFVLLFG